jgi:hypothetical protein
MRGLGRGGVGFGGGLGGGLGVHCCSLEKDNGKSKSNDNSKNNDNNKSEMRGFFAALRMTNK